MKKWKLDKVDKSLLRDLGDFLPPSTFDIHAHVCGPDTFRPLWRMLSEGPTSLTGKDWRKATQPLVHPAKLAGGPLYHRCSGAKRWANPW